MTTLSTQPTWPARLACSQRGGQWPTSAYGRAEVGTGHTLGQTRW